MVGKPSTSPPSMYMRSSADTSTASDLGTKQWVDHGIHMVTHITLRTYEENRPRMKINLKQCFHQIKITDSN